MVNLIGLGNVQPVARNAAEEIARTFNIYTIGGYRATGSVPDSDHPKGLAIDVMTHSGDAIANWAVNNASRLGIKYVIWNRRIWQNGSWTNYTGPSPHTDHVHISFYATAGSTDNVTNTNLANNAGCLANLLPTSKPSTDTTIATLFIVWSISMLKWGTPILAIMAYAKFGA
jgi:hypothetical protein